MEFLLGNLEMMEASVKISIVTETDIKQEVIQLATNEKEEFQMKHDPNERETKYVNTQDYLDIGETVLSDPNRAAPDVTTSPEEAAATEEVLVRHARKRAASASCDPELDEFRGFDLSDLDGSAAEYYRVIERMAAEISALMLTYTPVRTVAATRRAPARPDKRLRQSTARKSTEASLTELQNKERINTNLKILEESGIEQHVPAFARDKQMHKKEFACDICKKTFEHKKAMRKHITQVHNIIKCHFCPNKFGGVKNRNRHIAIHLEKIFECDMCKKKFSQKLGIRRHIRRYHGTMKCHFCPLKFGRETDRDNHIAYIHLEKKFECEICGDKFACDLYLHRHMASHENERLGMLSKTRDDVVVYTCGICGKEYYNAYILKRHQAVHTQKKLNIKRETFRCETCFQDFSTMKLLAFHKRVHQRPTFDCDICKKKYAHKKSLRVHMDGGHAGKKNYVCKLCPKRYRRKHSLTDHNKRAHKIHKEEKKKSDLVLNLAIFECEVCKKQYSSRCHLKRHLLIHTGKKRHQCSFCKKMFLYKHDLTVHVRTHTGEKPFACSKCNNKYAAVSNLRLHERNIHNIYARKLKV